MKNFKRRRVKIWWRFGKPGEEYECEKNEAEGEKGERDQVKKMKRP
jgi:hypothetical protein